MPAATTVETDSKPTIYGGRKRNENTKMEKKNGGGGERKWETNGRS